MNYYDILFIILTLILNAMCTQEYILGNLCQKILIKDKYEGKNLHNSKIKSKRLNIKLKRQLT